MNITEHVKGKVYFQYYRDGEMWYKTDTDFLFPVPVHDRYEIGNATFHNEDKALLFMRYIRKYMLEIENAKSKLSKD